MFTMRVLLLVPLIVGYCSAYNIEVLYANQYKLGEAPHWNGDKQELVFVDIEADKVFRYVPSTREYTEVSVDGRVSPVIPISGSENEYVLGVEKLFQVMTWDGSSEFPTGVITVAEVTGQVPTTRINDGKCDPSGRLIVGTYDESGGTGGNLYRFDSDGSLTLIQDNISVSNGLAWSADGKTMYYIDSPTQLVEAFDYDISNGTVSNRRTIFNVPENGFNQGTPDGMTIDSNGNLWVAVFGGSVVLNIDPTTGILLGTIDFTDYASQITSVTFGGEYLDVLYVTSAALDVEEPYSGSLFAVTGLGATGSSAGVPFVKNF